MSVFIGTGSEIEYPIYLVKFTVTGSEELSGTVGFFIADVNSTDGDSGVSSGALGVASDSGLISAIASYLGDNGWAGGTVSDLTVTEYNESSADATP